MRNKGKEKRKGPQTNKKVIASFENILLVVEGILPHIQEQQIKIKGDVWWCRKGDKIKL